MMITCLTQSQTLSQSFMPNQTKNNLIPVTTAVAPDVIEEIKKIQETYYCSQSNAVRILLHAGVSKIKEQV